jgi:hypothetical protein
MELGTNRRLRRDCSCHARVNRPSPLRDRRERDESTRSAPARHATRPAARGPRGAMPRWMSACAHRHETVFPAGQQGMNCEPCFMVCHAIQPQAFNSPTTFADEIETERRRFRRSGLFRQRRLFCCPPPPGRWCEEAIGLRPPRDARKPGARSRAVGAAAGRRLSGFRCSIR